MVYTAKIDNLTKQYLKKKALKGVSLQIPKGKIIGLLGPNGSGKTTMIKILTGLLRQSSGTVEIQGEKIGAKTKALVSFLPDRNCLYKWMKVSDALDFYEDFYKDFERNKASGLLKQMKVPENQKVKELSKGMTEKLLLTLVLSRRAKLYILDEPIAGVDPVAREQILDAILNSYVEGSSMLITTHLVTDIERIFDEVIFLKEGEIVLSGEVEQLKTQHSKSIDELFREVFQ